MATLFPNASQRSFIYSQWCLPEMNEYPHKSVLSESLILSFFIKMCPTVVAHKIYIMIAFFVLSYRPWIIWRLVLDRQLTTLLRIHWGVNWKLLLEMSHFKTLLAKRMTEIRQCDPNCFRFFHLFFAVDEPSAFCSNHLWKRLISKNSEAAKSSYQLRFCTRKHQRKCKT